MSNENETMRYRFMKTICDHNIKEFRARDIYDWIRVRSGKGVAYPGQVYTYIIHPLLREKTIIQTNVGTYAPTPEAKTLIEQIKHKSKTTRREISKLRKDLGIESETQTNPFEEATKEEEEDEWDRYIASKIKGQI